MRALLLLGAVAACAAAPPAEPVSPIPGVSRPDAAAEAPRHAQRVAAATTELPEGAVRVSQYVTFNADGRVVGVCLVTVSATGQQHYLPFIDPALAERAGPTPCGGR